MAITKYKVAALEVAAVEQAYATEILLDAANTNFTPLSPFTSDNVYDAIFEAVKRLVVVVKTATATISTSSTTFQTDTALTTTPGAGTYEVELSATGETTGINVRGEVALFKNGVQVAASTRVLASSTAILGLITLSTNAIAAPIHCKAEITCNGTDVITVQYREVSGTGNMTLSQRVLTFLQSGA